MSLSVKSVEDLLYKDISNYDEILKQVSNGKVFKQVDYLSFYCDPLKFDNSPFTYDLVRSTRDNPCWCPSDKENCFYMVDEDGKYFLQYVLPSHSPVMILRWARLNDKWLISIYGKALKLYYSGYIPWLRDYVQYYQCLNEKTQRVDLAFDSPEKWNDRCIDLPCSITIPDDDKWTYKGFGQKKSPCFIRIYDKTEDLRKDKFVYSWLYDDVYKKQIRRLEVKLTLHYARSLMPVEWLDSVSIDRVIERKDCSSKKMFLKNIFINALYMIDEIPCTSDQLDLLYLLSDKIGKKIKTKSKNIYFDNNDSDVGL